MNNEYEYIVNAFTKEGENTNLEVNNLNVTCITSPNNNFELDSDGNLTVNSIHAVEGITSFQDILDFIYPVGSIYLTTNLINPQVTFGGTWEQIKDRFLLACGDTYPNGSTGGEANHTLTINEMPSHNHAVYRGTDGNSFFGLTGKEPNGNLPYAIYTTDAGGNLAHNNMPPYLAVYVWKRVQ